MRPCATGHLCHYVFIIYYGPLVIDFIVMAMTVIICLMSQAAAGVSAGARSSPLIAACTNDHRYLNLGLRRPDYLWLCCNIAACVRVRMRACFRVPVCIEMR